MTDQPADLLTAAAQRLRDLYASAATHGSPHWTYIQRRDSPEYGGSGSVCAQDGKTIAGTRASVGGHTRVPAIIRPYGEWIATMDPATGLAIARMLDQAAEALAGQDIPDDEPALAVARAVLGQDGGQK
ncbi:hypothetical protein [Streptomyces sp. LS1784]|uniref:hypothetical protein n=1 Tax=Streptomyces sp. LS1784 TaxID=2851533 RepID=UPI001CCB2E01|nr:hypothetical protein [Streptomyces sp. LS1784]